MTTGISNANLDEDGNMSQSSIQENRTEQAEDREERLPLMRTESQNRELLMFRS